MADYLRVNGVPVPCTASEYEPVRLGEVSRSFNGVPRSSVRARKRDYRFTTGLLPLAEAEMVRALVEGEGHVWSFDDTSDFAGLSMLRSSRGLLPLTTGAVSDVMGKYGAGAVFEATEAPTVWSLGYDWKSVTLMYWAGEGTDWAHYLVRYPYPTTAWRNGSSSADPEYAWMNPDGTLEVNATPNGTFPMDELVVLPYAVPDAWVPYLCAFHTAQPFAALPFVHVGGEGMPAGGLTCMGVSGTGRRTGLAVGSRFTTGEMFDFTLYGG